MRDHSYVSKVENHNAIPLGLKDSDPGYSFQDNFPLLLLKLKHFKRGSGGRWKKTHTENLTPSTVGRFLLT